MNRYRVTVESMSSSEEPLQFEVENHDDIAAIARKTPSRFGLSEDDTKALVIGFKLFGEIVLKKRKGTALQRDPASHAGVCESSETIRPRMKHRLRG